MRIARLWGTDWRVHPLWLPLAGAAVLLGQWQDMLMLFVLVMLHELTHGLAAGMLGLHISSVTITPLGGTARIDGLMEAGPSTEWIVAAAGPLCNAILSLVAVFLHRYEVLPITETQLDGFVAVNTWLVLVNLLPALPLDGGRMLRAFLARFLGFRTATEYCAYIAMGCAVVAAGWWGLQAAQGNWQWSLAAFAVFLGVSAFREKQAAPYIFLLELTNRKDALKDKGSLPVGQLAVRHNVCLQDCLRRFKPSRYYIVMVLDEQGKVAGTLTESEIVDAIIKLGPLAVMMDAL